MAQPPSPHAITGSLPGNLPRSSGRKTRWPGDPRAGSDRTLYGPGIAFGAPSRGSVVLTRSAPGPGACANEAHAARTNAVVSADCMRRSLATFSQFLVSKLSRNVAFFVHLAKRALCLDSVAIPQAQYAGRPHPGLNERRRIFD